MVRSACFDSNGMKKGAWSEDEDNKLRAFILSHGHSNWRLLPKYAVANTEASSSSPVALIRETVEDKGKETLIEPDLADTRPKVVRRILLNEERSKRKNDPGLTTNNTTAFKRKHASTPVKTGQSSGCAGCVAEGSDSDFASPLPKQVKKPRVVNPNGQSVNKANRAAKKHQYKKVKFPPKDDYPTLNTRSTPRCLFDAVRKMNARQMQAVKDMGFGNLLNINIRMLPQRLAYWLVDNFSAKRCALTLQDGMRLPITEEDVQRVLGFPNGKRDIELLKRDETTDLYKKWKQLFKEGKIWLLDVANAMLRCEEGGLWFKIHFMILISTTLIESHKNGHIFPYIMRCLEDINNVDQWNWAGYVIRSLIRNKRTWANDTSQMFAGPAMFLVVFYVDRIKVFNARVDRSYPLYINWTSELLRKREKEEIQEGGFGEGDMSDPIVLPGGMENNDANVVSNSGAQAAADLNAQHGEVESCADQIMKNLKLYNGIRDKILVLIESASDVEMTTEKYKDAVADAEKSWIWRSEQSMHKKCEGVAPTTQVNDKPEGGSIGFAEGGETHKEDGTKHGAHNDELTNEPIEEWQGLGEIPTFSLGMSQLGLLHEGNTRARDTVQTRIPDLIPPLDTHIGDGDRETENIANKVRDDQLMGLNQAQSLLGQMPTRALVATGGVKQLRGSENTAGGRGSKHTTTGVPSCGVRRSSRHVEQPRADTVVYDTTDMTTLPERPVLVTMRANQIEEIPGTDNAVIGAVVKTSNLRGKENTLVQNDVSRRKGKQEIVFEELPITENPARDEMRITRCRPKESMKPSEFVCSPYMERRLNPSKKLSTDEEAVAMFAMHNQEDDEEELVFAFGGLELRRIDMSTLCKGNIVGTRVIDAWSMLLNHKERYRAAGSPLRFFASTKICIDALHQPPSAHNYESRRSSFFGQITRELSHYNHTPHAMIDLFVFPVYQDMIYYTIAVDARIGTAYIIDSRNEGIQDCSADKYGWIVNEVRNKLGDYLNMRNQTYRGNLLKKTKPVAMQIKWGDRSNTTDTGVYTMRHMETYMGETSMSWSSGLLAKSARQLKILRVRYCVAILIWEANEVKDEVTITADYFYSELLKNPNVNIRDALIG